MRALRHLSEQHKQTPQPSPSASRKTRARAARKASSFCKYEPPEAYSEGGSATGAAPAAAIGADWAPGDDAWRDGCGDHAFTGPVKADCMLGDADSGDGHDCTHGRGGQAGGRG